MTELIEESYDLNPSADPSWLLRAADNRDPQSFASGFRKRRFELFRKLLATVPRPVSICDVGGTVAFWKDIDLVTNGDVTVTIYNLVADEPAVGELCVTAGDARELPIADQAFDVVFSNSVIEHVGTFADQRRMADEVRRVGKRHFVQTPNYFFPLEPHFLVPGFQFLPLSIRASLLTKHKLGWTPRTVDRRTAMEIVSSIRLLRLAELRKLFPFSRIHRERVFGMCKSFIALGGWES